MKDGGDHRARGVRFARLAGMALARSALPVLFILLASCATRTPGAQPHDMSAASHETTAAHEELAAREEEQRYDPAARQRDQKCRAATNAKLGMANEPCWTSVTNPTAEHLKRAEEHLARAAEHRAASQALRDAEARACVGVPAADRDASPFDHREDIARVEPLYVKEGGKSPSQSLVGAVAVFRAVPGMTAQWLQRVVDCHLARNAALGHDVPEMSYCPLVPKGVSATVTPAQGGLAIEIRSDDPATAKEILRRAEAARSR